MDTKNVDLMEFALMIYLKDNSNVDVIYFMKENFAIYVIIYSFNFFSFFLQFKFFFHKKYREYSRNSNNSLHMSNHDNYTHFNSYKKI